MITSDEFAGIKKAEKPQYFLTEEDYLKKIKVMKLLGH